MNVNSVDVGLGEGGSSGAGTVLDELEDYVFIPLSSQLFFFWISRCSPSVFSICLFWTYSRENSKYTNIQSYFFSLSFLVSSKQSLFLFTT